MPRFKLLNSTVGGANELNIWLNSQGYYSTKTANLGMTQDITGVATSVYDLTNLLNQLAQDKLVNEKVGARQLRKQFQKRQCLLSLSGLDDCH